MVRLEQPDLYRELILLKQGYNLIAGIDEAGRGAWAGPVVAAACILPLADTSITAALDGVRDSKLLSARQREECYRRITAYALDWGVGIVSAQDIDRIGILPATRLAMQQAALQLHDTPDLLLIDAVRLPALTQDQVAEPKADRHYLSVAAASIIAKVTRDRLMTRMDEELPGYAFARHKGYGTSIHRANLQVQGISREHRRTFSPMRGMLEAITAPGG